MDESCGLPQAYFTTTKYILAQHYWQQKRWQNGKSEREDSWSRF